MFTGGSAGCNLAVCDGLVEKRIPMCAAQQIKQFLSSFQRTPVADHAGLFRTAFFLAVLKNMTAWALPSQ
jgi:hypothetical protein